MKGCHVNGNQGSLYGEADMSRDLKEIREQVVQTDGQEVISSVEEQCVHREHACRVKKQLWAEASTQGDKIR